MSHQTYQAIVIKRGWVFTVAFLKLLQQELQYFEHSTICNHTKNKNKQTNPTINIRGQCISLDFLLKVEKTKREISEDN